MKKWQICGLCKAEEFDFSFSGWLFKGTEVRGTAPSYWESNQGVSHVNSHVNVLTPGKYEPSRVYCRERAFTRAVTTEKLASDGFTP